MDYKETISISSIAVHLLAQEDQGEKLEQFLRTLIAQRDKCEKMLSRVISRMRDCNNPDCQVVVACLGYLPEGASLSSAVSLFDVLEKSYAYMENQGYSGSLLDFVIDYGSKIFQKLGEQPPSGEDFPGTSGRKK